MTGGLPQRAVPGEDGRQLRTTDHEALANLRTVLEPCRAGELKCSATTGRPSATTIRTVGTNLADGDFYPDHAIAAFAWPLLLQSGGLAKLDGTRLRLTPKGLAALRKPPAEVVRGLWQRWLTHGLIDEFSRIENIKGQRSRNVLTAPKGRRPAIGAALAMCPPAEWVGVDALFHTMRQHRISPVIARSERALWKLYLVDPYYGSLGYAGYGDWALVEGRYTLAVLFEYAGTLGLIDLDYVEPAGARNDYRDNWGADDLDALSRYDGLTAIRLTDLGCYVLGLADDYQQPVGTNLADGTTGGSSPVTVLANLDVVATGALPTADRLLLSAYAAQTSDHVWTVSADSLLAAVDSGRKLSEFTAFLTAHTRQELPNPVETLIADIERRAAALTDLGHVRVIECADDATAALLANDRRLRPLCRAIGGRHIAIAFEQEQKFRKALLKCGYAIPPCPGVQN